MYVFQWLLIAFLLGLVAFMAFKTQPQLLGARKKNSKSRKLLVQPRRIANSTERTLWRWLQSVFPDHHIMLKLPITRFTLAQSSEQAQDSFPSLSGLYCTFTICTDSGRVIGCLDVSGERALSHSNQQLKQNLLGQCDMAYWVLLPDSLPDPSALRAAFFGFEDEHQESIFVDISTNYDSLASAKENLSKLLDRQRNTRQQPMSNGVELDSTSSAWNQADSFLMPLQEQARMRNG